MATLTLSDTITAFQREFRVDGEVTSDHHVGYRFRIDNEAFELAGFVQERWGDKPFRRDNPRFWRVTRGILGTTKAEHDADVALYAIVDELATSGSASEVDGLITQDGDALTEAAVQTLIDDSIEAIEQTALADQGALTATAPDAITAANAVGAAPTDDEHDALVTDVTALRTTLAAVVVDLGATRTKLNAALAKLRLAGIIADA